MEKEVYTKPIVEVVEFDVLEPIMASGDLDTGLSGDTGAGEWPFF